MGKSWDFYGTIFPENCVIIYNAIEYREHRVFPVLFPFTMKTTAFIMHSSQNQKN